MNNYEYYFEKNKELKEVLDKYSVIEIELCDEKGNLSNVRVKFKNLKDFLDSLENITDIKLKGKGIRVYF